MGKKVFTITLIIFILLFIIPVPMRLKDGGTVVYRSLIYKISDVHKINPDITSDKPYIEGIIIEILGAEIINTTDK